MNSLIKVSFHPDFANKLSSTSNVYYLNDIFKNPTLNNIFNDFLFNQKNKLPFINKESWWWGNPKDLKEIFTPFAKKAKKNNVWHIHYQLPTIMKNKKNYLGITNYPSGTSGFLIFYRPIALGMFHNVVKHHGLLASQPQFNSEFNSLLLISGLILFFISWKLNNFFLPFNFTSINS